MRTVVLTVSTSVARRAADDEAGPRLAHLADEAGAEIVAMEVVPDDAALIEDRLHHYVAEEVSFIFTTGGTGSPDDVTPEATRAVITRDAPGIAEAMRATSLQHTPMGMLARGVSGIAGRTLIVNFPGNPRAVDQLFGVVAPVLNHAAATLDREGGRAGGHWLDGLTRRYGERVALDEVTLRVPTGATLVVFGPNGAGKSTLLRVLATLLRPHAGSARVLGHELPGDGWAVRGRVGLLGHEPLVFGDLSGRENLRFHARLHRVAPARVEELLELVGLRRRADDRVHTYSRGWSSGCPWPARCCTSPSCCSASPAPISTQPPRTSSSRSSAPRAAAPA